MDIEILEEMPSEIAEFFCEQVLKRDWPDSMHAYYFIKNGFKWNKSNAPTSYKLYYVPSDIENGTFLGIQYQVGNQYPVIIVTYTFPGNEDNYIRILSSTKRFNWQRTLLFQANVGRMVDVIKTTIKTKGLESKLYADSILKWMPANEAAQLELKIPDDVFISQLNKNHVDFMYSQWKHSDVYSKSDIEDSVIYNFGYGIFSKNNNDLLAWAMCGSYGGLTTLVVRSDKRNNGLGKLITKAVTKQMGLRGISPHAIISRFNDISLTMFDKIGYNRKDPIPMLYFIVERYDNIQSKTQN
ncbi:uncharacterized protein LOC126901397 [Daktulosphaira vitifoliae]|uniref:uncharacterized protein LOC126901397 n=1 Tax=Daktulosphaira vitifoliae TaxID=58002 RepID=UPI0021A9FB5C|nr:uncharacterized protein LOC126901397 [Daktulosphaira vitifoliae]